MLPGTNITDATLRHIASFTTLRSVDTRNTQVTVGGVAAFRNALPDCAIVSNFSEQEIEQAIARIRVSNTTPTANGHVTISHPDATLKETAKFPSPEQRKFLDAVAALTTKERLAAVTDQLKQVNHGFNLNRIYTRFDGKFEHTLTDDRVTSVTITGAIVSELWPLMAFPELRKLDCSGTTIERLEPLGKLTKLVSLDCSKTGIRDLAPLAALKELQRLDCRETDAHDLTPLAGLPLVELNCLAVTPYNESAVAVVKSLSQLKTLNDLAPTDWLARRDQVEQLRKTAAAFPVEKQFERVIALMKEFNPGYDGTVRTHKIEGGKSVYLDFYGQAKSLTDLSPLKGMELKYLAVSSSNVADLSPLVGMPLTELNLRSTKVVDLTPLEGMPLTKLQCSGSRVYNLAPLKGMKLTLLDTIGLSIEDLAPLEGMKLTNLFVVDGKFVDLSPLRGMPLTSLQCSGSRVADLSPLRGAPLVDLRIARTPIRDLAPLEGMSLKILDIRDTRVSDLSALEEMKLGHLLCNQELVIKARAIKTLKLVNGVPISELTDELRRE